MVLNANTISVINRKIWANAHKTSESQ